MCTVKRLVGEACRPVVSLSSSLLLPLSAHLVSLPYATGMIAHAHSAGEK